MRAGLFLEGLGRSHSVRVLVVPVFGWSDPPGDFVRRHADAFDVLELEPPADPLTEFGARLATRASRRRAEALHPMPALCRWADARATEGVAAAADGCDAVHVLRLYLAPYLDAVLDHPARPPLVLDVDDLESTTNRSLGRDDEAERYARLEAWYLPLFDRVVTCSRRDTVALRPRYEVAEIPNAVRPPAAEADPAARHDLLFVGNLSYAPNVEAARWLCEVVVPRLGRVTVALVGAAPTPEVRALGATVAADVPSVAPWYAGAKVAVVPLQAGGGTRTKVLEAFVHRRPVVATALGVEGLDLGDAVLVADAPEDFAAACRRLLDDPDLGARLAAKGEALVAELASVDVVAGSIDALFRNILAP
jgi:glycosyltransferase involved in cell wall biosynthesis